MIKNNKQYWIFSTILISLLSLLVIWRINYFTLLNLFSILLFTGFSLLVPPQLVFSQKTWSVLRIQIKHNQLFDAFAACIALAILFLGSNRTFFDDVGFTLRYLDNFSNGYFYCFNPSDGAVFGISGFLNTLFCGGIAWLHILSSHHVLLFSNVLGMWLIAYVSLRILRVFCTETYILLLLWFLMIFCVKDLINVAFSGIETAFHLSIMLLAILYMLKGKARAMWLALSLSIISKLDAVPIAVVIGILYLIKQKKQILPLKLKNKLYSDFLLFAFIPLGLWVVVMYILFGSPFPQSAFAKVHFYPHPDNHWFPFLTGYTQDHYLLIILIAFWALFLLHLFVSLIRPQKYSINELSFGFSFSGSLLLYYFYNPGEKMMWYYAVPSFFMIAQIGVSLVKLLPPPKNYKIHPGLILVFIALFIFLRNDISASRIWMNKNMNITENERILIGEYLGNISSEKDTLLSKHGHLSRHFKGYVIDNSGLNSRLATDYKLNTDSLIKDFQPQYVINHAWSNFIETMNQNNYMLKEAFYDISLYDSPNWLLFKRIDQKEGMNIILEKVDVSKFSGIEKTFDLNYVTRFNGKKLRLKTLTIKNHPTEEPIKVATRLVCGIVKKQSDFNLNVKIYQFDKVMEEKKYRIEKIGGGISRFVQTIEIPLNYSYLNNNPIEFSSADGEKIAIINPYIEYVILDQ
jgi:hypothetical protein